MTYSQRHCLNISWTTVSHPLFELLLRSLSGTRPFNMRYSSGELRFNRYMSCSWPFATKILSCLVSGRTDINGYIPDTYRMPNAREPDKPHTNAQVTFIHRTSTGHLYPVASVRSFEHVQNLPTDKTGQNGHHLTRNAFTAWGTDKKRMRTDTNGQRILLSVTRPLALSGKVWQGLKPEIIFYGCTALSVSELVRL